MRRDIADDLYKLVYKRFREEQPERELTHDELSNIWYTIYGKLYRGEPENEVRKWCETVPLSKKKIHKPIWTK